MSNSTIMADQRYWNSIGLKIQLNPAHPWHSFFIRPILDPKFPLILTCHNGHMSSFRSSICCKCHSIFIIGVIDVRESSPSVQEAPIWLFIYHVHYISFQIQPMMHMEKCIILLNHPRTLGFPCFQNCKRRMPCDTKILACVGSIISMCLHDPLPLQFFFYLFN